MARARLREVLGRECGRAPNGLRFAYGQYGKPWLPAHPMLRFNLTHAGAVGLVAVAVGRDVGVDVEPTNRRGDLGEVATRFFSPTERAALAALDGGARAGATLRCWCRKEAYLKARGDGLTRSLDSFDVAVGERASSVLIATRPDPTDADAWHVTDLDVGPGYVAALAVGRGQSDAVPIVAPWRPTQVRSM
ncbi:MAG: 4'-phosphopantetheinyl transferase superfamily protein [Candidatus Binatia bacterium]